MSTITDLAYQPSTPMSGVYAGYSDWRFYVRIAKAPTGAVLGNFILGTDVLSELVWQDVTNDLYGLTLTRGAPAGGRAGAGQMSVQLKNDADTYSPWRSIYHGPGTLIQAGFNIGAGPSTALLYTGFTISWNEAQDGRGATRWVDIDALETIALLGESNPVGISPTGAGETFYTRLTRILNIAGWQFSSEAGTSLVASVGSWGLQASSFAQNSLSEVYLLADSITAVAYSTKFGDVRLSQRNGDSVPVNFGGTEDVSSLGVSVPIVADSIQTANDDDNLLGVISVARTGGTAVTYENSGIQGRYQTRSSQRFDLITQDPGGNADLARFANDQLTRRKSTYRVKNLELDSLDGAQVFKFVSALDLYSLVNVKRPDPAPGTDHGVIFNNYAVCGYTLTINSINPFAGLHITARIETEPTPNSSFTRY